MIYVTGDTHIPYDIHKLGASHFAAQKSLTREDYVVICGDFGGIWQAHDPEAEYWLKWLNRKNFTTLFVDGNHENFDLLDACPVEMWCGGQVHRIRDNILHLMRGQVFHIDGLKIFTMGGAASLDKYARVEGKSWWARELPSLAEYEEAAVNLAEADHQVDFVFTHTAPTSIAAQLRQDPAEKELTDFLEHIKCTVEFRGWFFGHFHQDIDIENKYYAMFNRVMVVWPQKSIEVE